MSFSTRVEDAQHQVVDSGRAMMRLGWAMTVFGAQQAVDMANPSKISKTGTRLATALEEVTHAIESHLGKGFQGAYEAGAALATSPVDGIPTFEIYRAMQSLAMQPVVFGSMKAV